MKVLSHQLIEFPSEISKRVVICCRAAAEREERGEDEQACEILGGFWSGPGASPDIDGLPAPEAAHLLTRAGALTAKLGSQHQVEGWQELAKNLLSRAADLADIAGAAWVEARKCLATCYWREGAFDEARLTLQDVLERCAEGPWRFAVMIDLAMIERGAGHPHRALEIYRSTAAEMNEQSSYLQATYHNGLALALKAVSRIDDALIEMTAASYYFERAGNRRYQIAAEINLGNLFTLTKRFAEAHQHLDRAEHVSNQLGDELHSAQAKDSRALAYLSEGNAEAAEPEARASVEILDHGDHYSLLVDSLITHGRILSRLGDDKALRVYLRAYELAAEKLGSERAGTIAREVISELAGDACLRALISLDDAVNAFEASIIKRGLEVSGGKQREAAMRLGLKHQTLSLILHTRHKSLRPNPERKPRRQSIIKKQ